MIKSDGTLDIKSHMNNVYILSIQLAVAIGISGEELLKLKNAALMHDIGKFRIPSEILDKNGPLTDSEWETIKTHAEIGSKILAESGAHNDIVTAVRHHHEKYDGTGYPEGIKGSDIPLFSRIISIADSFDAMTSNRPYSNSKTIAEALHEIEVNSGRQFDPELANAFINMLKQKSAVG